MKKLIAFAMTVALVLGLSVAAMAADTDSHVVTVTVDPINEIDVDNNLTLIINSATPGSDPDPVTDSTTCDLSWTTNQTSKKITVKTNLAAPKFSLEVEGINLSGSNGSAAGLITLTTGGADFITGISVESASCDLSYTATATAADGTGSDTHTITYTIVDE